MSTHLHLVCEDHTPPLVSEIESGQHLYDLPRIRAEIADREALVAEYETGSMVWEWNDDAAAYFRVRSAAFLAGHPTCRIGIRDEYGDEYPVSEGDR